MTFFKAKKSSHINIRILTSITAFIIIIMMCIYGADSLWNENISMQKNTLEDALHNSTIQYYALEGYYPENLNELLSSCAIRYDESKFFIDYQPIAANIMPEIIVIVRK